MLKALCIAALCLGGAIVAGACIDSMDRNDTGEPCGSDGCAPPEELVSKADPADESLVIIPRQCGNTVCTGNTHCCNASCGICVLPREVCTQQVCSSTD